MPIATVTRSVKYVQKGDPGKMGVSHIRPESIIYGLPIYAQIP
jgi:hypothetical protein